MDGGIQIVKVKTIVENWKRIKEDLIRGLSRLEYHNSETEKTKTLPDDITGYDGDKIVEMLSYLNYCDCPCNYEENIIFSSGDNLAERAEVLARVTWFQEGCKYIETWT